MLSFPDRGYHLMVYNHLAVVNSVPFLGNGFNESALFKNIRIMRSEIIFLTYLPYDLYPAVLSTISKQSRFSIFFSRYYCFLFRLAIARLNHYLSNAHRLFFDFTISAIANGLLRSSGEMVPCVFTVSYGWSQTGMPEYTFASSQWLSVNTQTDGILSLWAAANLDKRGSFS